jgi:hypothetical protein
MSAADTEPLALPVVEHMGFSGLLSPMDSAPSKDEDQSGICTLHAFKDQNVAELDAVFEHDHARNGLAWRLPREEMVWVDPDMTGFSAEGKTYEGTTK